MCVRFPSYGKGLDNYLYLFTVHWRPSVWVLEDHRANLNYKLWYFAGHFETIRKRTAHELVADLRTRNWGRRFNQSPRLPLCKMQVHPQRIGVVERHQRLLCLFLVSLLLAARTLRVSSSTPQFNLQCYDKTNNSSNGGTTEVKNENNSRHENSNENSNSKDNNNYINRK